jgi:phosphoglycolate phosphatase-like HAD superfamily hydrolase
MVPEPAAERADAEEVILYLFDIDGTLLHAHGSGRGAFDAVMEAQHGVTNACEGMRFGGKTDPALVDEIFAARLGRAPTDGERAAFLAAYVPVLRDSLARNGVEIIPGVVAALDYLASQPVVLGLATGNIRAGADAKLCAAGLGGRFVVGGFGSDASLRAELVAVAIRRGREMGATGEVVVVGDTIHDIAAARANGATVVAVATGADPAEKLGDADAVLTTLGELSAWHTERF